MQKALIVNYDLSLSVKMPEEASRESTSELNGLLADGWRVVCASPLSGNAGVYKSQCLVVIEKDD